MRIAGAILAAGASTRMGTPKALLSIGSSTFLDFMCKALSDGGCESVLAVVAGSALMRIRSECCLKGVKVVVNPDPSRGQISSLRCALDAVPDAYGLLIALVDQGYIEPQTVRAVLHEIQKASLVIARYNGKGGHPTAFSRKLFSQLRAQEADCGAHIVVRAERQAHRVAWVDVDDAGVTRNINTPSDYQRFLAQFSCFCL